MREVYSFLETLLFNEEQYWVVAVSGGPDSMGLLYCLQEFKKKYPFIRLVCAVVNHNTGRVGQFEEQEFLRKYCDENGIIFETITLNRILKDNFHRKAHELRYSFFESLVRKYHSPYLFTAHHADDLVETILMRILRGSTLGGYGGFLRVSDRNFYKIIRPFIYLYKNEILNYVNDNGVPYFIDSSNEKDIYTRNRIRKYVVPSLKEECKKLGIRFYKFGAQMDEYYNYVENEAFLKKQEVYCYPYLNVSRFLEFPILVQRHILMQILKEIYVNDLYLIQDKHIDILLDVVSSKTGSVQINLPKLVVFKEYERLVFHYEVFNGYVGTVKNHNVIHGYGCIDVLDSCEYDDNNVCRLSCDDVVFPLSIRCRKAGDIVFVKGLNGSKKLQDIFVNEKVPRSRRDGYPLVVDATDKIVWIPSLKKTKFDKTKDEKYDIILKYYEGGK